MHHQSGRICQCVLVLLFYLPLIVEHCEPFADAFTEDCENEFAVFGQATQWTGDCSGEITGLERFGTV